MYRMRGTNVYGAVVRRATAESLTIRANVE